MTLKINDRFSAERDSISWTLSERRRGVNNNGVQVETIKQTWYSDFGSMMKAIIDKSLDSCESIEEVHEAYKDIVKHLKLEKANALRAAKAEYEVAE